MTEMQHTASERFRRFLGMTRAQALAVVFAELPPERRTVQGAAAHLASLRADVEEEQLGGRRRRVDELRRRLYSLDDFSVPTKSLVRELSEAEAGLFEARRQLMPLLDLSES